MREVLKFRKKTVVIEAMQFTEGEKNQVFNWITGNHYPLWDADGRPAIVIGTHQGYQTASLGDWIIKDPKGEFYACKPDIFALTYEPVDTRHDPAEALAKALRDIACFDDDHASQRLSETGSYALFDEPYSVRIARTALASYEAQKEQ